MFTEHSLSALPNPITALPDVPQLTADELKQYFDGNAEALRLSVNGLADDGKTLENKVEGIVAQTYVDTIHESMLDQPLAEKINDKVDSAAFEDAITTESSQRKQNDAALLTQLESRTIVEVGSYAGTGTVNRILNLGYQPLAVIVSDEQGFMTAFLSNYYYCYGGIALRNLPVYTEGNTENIALSIVSTGFMVTYSISKHLFTNQSGKTYRYIVIH